MWTATANCLVVTAQDTLGWRDQAACRLLAEQGHWPDLLDRVGLIEWDNVARRLDDDGDSLLYGSPAERTVLRFALELATGHGGDWAAGLSSLDHINRRLLLAALAWAADGRRAAHPYMDQPDDDPTPARRHLRSVQP